MCKALTISLNSREAFMGPPPELAYRLIGEKKFIVEYPHVLIFKNSRAPKENHLEYLDEIKTVIFVEKNKLH